MRHLALTGGIGSGKSTVATFFAERGATIIDADAISRALMEPGQEVLDEVVDTFGEHLLDAAGRLDRAALANIVFNDNEARERLNGIVHPAVRSESARLREEALAADPDHRTVWAPVCEQSHPEYHRVGSKLISSPSTRADPNRGRRVHLSMRKSEHPQFLIGRTI